MLKTLIKKEIQANVFSFRFLVIAALLVLVVPVTTLVLTNDAVKKVDEFSFRRQAVENYLKSYAHFNRLNGIVTASQPPLPFYALVRGISSDVNIGEFDDDPLPVMFPLLDLTFIVAILLSLAALIFSYDAVCGEKEDGTLKLMLANGLSRSRILLGKVIGGTLTLFVPFLLSLILGLIVILLNSRVAWGGADWAALVLVLAGAVVYVFVFLVLGVFISARHHSSSASIMTSLCVWVVFVLVIPNLSPYLASLLSPAPSQIKTSRETSRMRDVDRDDLGRKLYAERLREVIKQYPVLNERLSEAEEKARAERDPLYKAALQARTDAFDKAWAEANRIQNAKAGDLEDELQRKLDAQTKLAGRLSMASPLADFTYYATDLTSTGMRNLAHFGNLNSLWQRSRDDYSRARIAALQKKDPATDWWNVPVDVSDMPRFRYSEEALGSRWKGGLAPLSVLIVFGAALFGAAFVSFIRYDAR